MAKKIIKFILALMFVVTFFLSFITEKTVEEDKSIFNLENINVENK